MRTHFKSYLLTLLVFALTACAGTSQTPVETAPDATPVSQVTQGVSTETLSVMTHDSFAISEEVVNAFKAEHNAEVRFILGGDAGTALNKAILSRDQPLADVFYGVDNTYLSRALEEGIFTAYASPLLEKIPDQFELDPQHRALPVDYGDVCLNYDKSYFEDEGLAPPQTLEDLLQPQYQGLLVVQNPASSSPGLAFLLTTIAHFGEQGYLDYWRGLVDNDVRVVQDWDTAYYTEFSGSSGNGPRPIVVSYGSSPAFEAVYADPPVDVSPTAAVTGDETCFRQIEFVGILEGSSKRALAEKWIDYMLSIPFQENMLSNMAVYPVNEEADLDPAFVEYLIIPENPAVLDPETIATNRETWIQDWTEVVLR